MRVPVTDLVGRPGHSRRVDRRLEKDQIGDAPLGPAEGAVTGSVVLALRLESVVEGILVRGTVTFDVELGCARCLEPVGDQVELDVAELFRPVGHEDAEEGYEIRDEAIDLEALLRDAIVMSVPVRVLCREDCQGLCVVCGADRNTVDCGHDRQELADPRWSKLRELNVPPSHN